MALRDLKTKIRSIEKTGKVTRAMEAVSAVKMRKSQAKALAGRPYAVSAVSILARLAKTVSGKRHPLATPHIERNIRLVVVTSDKGLAGSLNAGVLRAAQAHINTLKLSKEAISVVAIGRKAADYFRTRGYAVVKSFENMGDSISSADMEILSTYLRDAYISKEFDTAYLVYSNFRTTLTQEPIIRKLVPLTIEELRSLVVAITPEHGRYAGENDGAKSTLEYTVEPDPEEVLNSLYPKLVSVALYHALLESKASEHSARMVAMKNATEKADELAHELTLRMNRERQALITREVSEITGGIEALRA